MKDFYVLTGTGREYFDTLDDAKIFARYIKGVVRDSATDDTIVDYYNEEEECVECEGYKMRDWREF